MFAIDIASFESGAHHVVRTPSAEAVDLESVPAEMGLEGLRDLEVDADLFCERRRILVHLKARATAALTCDRTLRPFNKRIEGAYSVLFAAPEAQPAEESDDYDEVRTFSPTDPSLDLTDVVRDTLLLAVPQRKVAPGADEKELTTSFGAETNDGSKTPVDPRWEKLRQLRDE